MISGECRPRWVVVGSLAVSPGAWSWVRSPWGWMGYFVLTRIPSGLLGFFLLKESEQVLGVTIELLFPHQVSVRMETGKAYHRVSSVRLLEAQNQ